MGRLSRQTGLSVRLLSQEEETQCDCESLRLFSSGQSQALGCDIGGGSGQLFAYREQQRFGISLPLGSLRLASQWVMGKLPDPAGSSASARIFGSAVARGPVPFRSLSLFICYGRLCTGSKNLGLRYWVVERGDVQSVAVIIA